ncbi:LytR C-terminal domain-containing protein, partial [Actinomadura sp. 7K534]|uniref:LytR C-terminal domain-containing protein n=1 Tax=Actinomadura sp. 7K534 TaxID=2530366 RepID=UPI0010533503
AQVEVGVYNAAGTPGLAQRTADQLTERGFQVVKVGTADRTYARTQILYGAGAERQAARVAIAVPGPEPRAWRSARPGRVYLVIGKSGARLRGLNASVPRVAGEIRADRDVCAAT